MPCSELSAWLEIIKNIVTVIGVGIASYVAIRGLNTWREQLRGRAEHDAAHSLLKAVYHLREAINIVRNPFMSSSEISSSMEEAGITSEIGDDDWSMKSSVAVFQKRWANIVDSVSTLNVDSLEAEVIWGKEIQVLLKPVRLQISNLNNSISTFVRGLDPSQRRRINDESFTQAEQTVYGWFESESDEFSVKLQENIERIEVFLRPFIK